MRLPTYLLCMSIVVTSLSCSRSPNDDVESRAIPPAGESSPIGASALPAEMPSSAPSAIADVAELAPQLTQSAPTIVAPKAIDSTRGDVIFSLLTSQTWTSRAPDHKHPFGMCPVGEGDSEFRFLADGSYEHLWIPLVGRETVIKATGRWNLQRGHDKKWFACIDNGERHVVTLLEQGIVQLDGFKYPNPYWKHRLMQKFFTKCQPSHCLRKFNAGIPFLVHASGTEPMMSTLIVFRRQSSSDATSPTLLALRQDVPIQSGLGMQHRTQCSRKVRQMRMARVIT